MLFASYPFIGFLLLLVPLYYLLPRITKGRVPCLQWAILLGASYIFYWYADPKYLLFILFTTLTSYAAAIWMDREFAAEEAHIAAHASEMTKEERKAYRAARKLVRRRILTCALVLNFGVLAVLKYTGFAVRGVNGVLGLFGADGFTVPSLLLPMGISFYTFQTMGYLIDVYWKKTTAERSLPRLMLFVSYFPQLIQGPISRHSDLARELYVPHAFSAENVYLGLQRVLYGFCKKLIIADRVLVAMKTMLARPTDYTGAYVFFMILLYSVQIYADFTGGIDITIGVSQMLGIKLKENFRRPFSSRSTEEYWKRWHITMGTWFQDYIFYPIAVSSPMLKLSRKAKERFGNGVGRRISVYTCTVATWFLTGLWHGAGLNFIVWGLLNCAVLLISQELKPLYERFRKRFPRLTASRGYAVFMMTRTFLLMGAIRIFDCYRDVLLTFRMLWSMFSTPNLSSFLAGVSRLGLSAFDFVVIGVGILTMYAVSKIGGDADSEQSVRRRLLSRPWLSCTVTGAMLLLVLLLGMYGPGYDASQFIYGQF